jgi:nicotinamidase-related amidase
MEGGETELRRRAPRHRGVAEGEARSALLVVDMLNPYEHDEAEELAAHARAALPGVEALLGRARDAEVPVVFVNDNFGDWNSSAEELASRACSGAHPDLVEPVLPRKGDSFVIKARHSVFYRTPLEYLLDEMNVDRLIFAGQVTEQCILYSALDAYVRHFRVTIPTDAVAAIHDHLAEAALEMMKTNMSAELCRATECRL